MGISKRTRILGLWTVSMLLIALVFLSGVLDKQKVWPDVQLDCEKRVWRLEDGDAYGRVAAGPYYNLPVGRYRIKWQIEGDGENRMVLSCGNDARMTPPEIVIPSGQWEGEAWFTLEDPVQFFSINLEFASGSYMKLHNIRLYSPFYRDHAFTFAAVLLAACLLVTLQRRGRLTAQSLRELALLAMAGAFASIPCLGENAPNAYDTQFHAARIMNLADALGSGQLPARVGGFSYNGYGAMTSVFYPDLLLYPWALMALSGASMSYVINTLVIAVNAVAALCMRVYAGRLLRDRQAALCASVLYVLSIYRMQDIYARLMVGSMLAMAVLPLFMLGLHEVLLGDKGRWPLLVLGATLIFRSHMLTTVLCAAAAAAAILPLAGRLLREKRMGALAAAAGTTLMINLNQIVPLLMSLKAGVNTKTMQFGFAASAPDLKSLLDPAQYIGVMMIIGVAAYIGAPGTQEEKRERRVLQGLLLSGAACAVLATDIIPWAHIVKLTGGLVEVLQFPWRVLVFTTVCFALVGGDGLARLLGGRGLRAAVCALALGLVCTLPYIGSMPPYEDPLEFGQGARTYMIFPEYQIEGTDVNNTRSRQPILTGDVVLEQYEKDGTRVTAQVRADGDAQVTLPMFGFPGYAATLNNQPIDWTLGENNRLTVSLPVGTQGTLRVEYAGKAVWRAMDVISAASALGLAAYVLMRKKRRLN